MVVFNPESEAERPGTQCPVAVQPPSKNVIAIIVNYKLRYMYSRTLII